MNLSWRLKVIRFGCSVLMIFLLSTSNLAFGDIALDTGVFPNAKAIEKNLVRDQSTRADVQRLLGIPSGAGGALLPGFGKNSELVEPYDVWYYEDVKTGNFKSEAGIMVLDMVQQILLIFFKGDRYYGYFWTSNESTFEAQ